MSDALLRYVPADPGYVPDAGQVARATQLLSRCLPMAQHIGSRVEAQMVFVDAGENWEGVRCPACDADADDWWGEAMSLASKGQRHFEDLHVHAACCGAHVSLNELKYGWPVAFGRFILEARNPNGAGLSEQALLELGQVLGGPLRQIHAHV